MAQPLRLLQRLRGPTGQNLLSLYGVTAANYLFPLLTLPYLARVLGPSGFGALAIVQSLGQYLSLVVEYGFTLSATREVARSREDRARLAQILAEVLGARLLLACVVVALAYALALFVPALRANLALLWAGVFWAVALGMSPVWYFQGQERLRGVAILEVVAKAFGVAGIFAFVRSPDEAHQVLLLQGLAALLAGGVAWGWAWREVGFILPTPSSAIRGLRSGFSLFFFRAVVSLYTSANAFMLGLFVPTQQVGYYAGAERLTKALLALVEPLNRVFMPRFSYLLAHSPQDAERLFRQNTLLMGFLGTLGTVAVWTFSPLAVALLLGPKYEGAIPLMRVLALLLPLIALSNVWGLQWMLAHRLDRPFNLIILLGGLLNLVLALSLAPRFGALGMAWGVVSVEFWVTAAILVYLIRRRLFPTGGGPL